MFVNGMSAPRVSGLEINGLSDSLLMCDTFVIYVVMPETGDR